MNRINRIMRKIINEVNKKKLKNTDFSLISSNCNGGCILHDLGIKFNSPFIDLWIKPQDYLKCISNLRYYMNQELKFVKEENINYPVAYIDDVKLYFQHYSSETEASEKWNLRKKRINYDNIFFLMTDRDGCTIDDIYFFEHLEIKNKIILTNSYYPDISTTRYIAGFENEKNIGMAMEYQGKISGKKYYDQFDYVEWLNQGN